MNVGYSFQTVCFLEIIYENYSKKLPGKPEGTVPRQKLGGGVWPAFQNPKPYLGAKSAILPSLFMT